MNYGLTVEIWKEKMNENLTLYTHPNQFNCVQCSVARSFRKLMEAINATATAAAISVTMSKQNHSHTFGWFEMGISK